MTQDIVVLQIGKDPQHAKRRKKLVELAQWLRCQPEKM
jgi:hypothetical protein